MRPSCSSSACFRCHIVHWQLRCGLLCRRRQMCLLRSRLAHRSLPPSKPARSGIRGVSGRPRPSSLLMRSCRRAVRFQSRIRSSGPNMCTGRQSGCSWGLLSSPIFRLARRPVSGWKPRVAIGCFRDSFDWTASKRQKNAVCFEVLLRYGMPVPKDHCCFWGSD
jgi:hypothetical protein